MVGSVAIIAARSRNGIIGNGDSIPWQVKGEQALFRDITMGGVLIMGRRTFESIGRPLPGRTTLIVTRDVDYHANDCLVSHSLTAALDQAQQIEGSVFIAGGGQIYAQALPLVDLVHLTTIELDVEGDISFPLFPTPDFELIEEQRFQTNHAYLYQVYRRRHSQEGEQCSSTIG